MTKEMTKERKSRKTFATETFRILNNRMLYYRRVLNPANQPIGVQGQQKINQKIKNKYENCLRIKKLLHRAIRHLYDDSNITPQTLKKKMKLRCTAAQGFYEPVTQHTF